MDRLRWALVARSRDPEADLRHRIECGYAVGDLGDPRFERRMGPHGEYLLPPMVAIPGGVYLIGDDEPIWVAAFDKGYRSHMPRHAVTITAFQIGQFPVTNAEWACFVAAGGYDEEQWWDTPTGRAWRSGEGTADGTRAGVRYGLRRIRRDPAELETWHDSGQIGDEAYERWHRRLAMTEAEFEAHLAEMYPGGRLVVPRFWNHSMYNQPAQPVVGVCWHEVRAFAGWTAAQTGLPFRLPSEVEWEAAARGLGGRPFAYGEAFDPLWGNTLLTHLGRPTPVGVFVEGDTPEGVCDLGGNVMAWTSSAFGNWLEDPEGQPLRFGYPYTNDDGREEADMGPEIARVQRGGAWYQWPELARATVRTYAHHGYRSDCEGGRLGLSGSHICRP
jgi:formylglycine-generating enzyme required for sulfatase activity